LHTHTIKLEHQQHDRADLLLAKAALAVQLELLHAAAVRNLCGASSGDGCALALKGHTRSLRAKLRARNRALRLDQQRLLAGLARGSEAGV
jgi:hypothetical protein